MKGPKDLKSGTCTVDATGMNGGAMHQHRGSITPEAFQ